MTSVYLSLTATVLGLVLAHVYLRVSHYARQTMTTIHLNALINADIQFTIWKYDASQQRHLPFLQKWTRNRIISLTEELAYGDSASDVRSHLSDVPTKIPHQRNGQTA